MQRLDFSLPDFCRVSWTSESARAHWEPQISRGAALWHELELETVLAGMRPAGLITIRSTAMPAVTARCEAHGMALRQIYAFSPASRYVSDYSAAHDGDRFLLCAAGRADDAAAAEAAYTQRQSAELATLLGYPSCCAEFFADIWDRQRYIDTTWKMAESGHTPTDDNIISANAPPELNLLLRWLGIRAVFHLPCSTHCLPSIAVAGDIAAIARRRGQGEDIDAIYRMLSWPAQWSGLHGIAEIETPVLRIATRTDATATKYTVRLQGQARTAEYGASGNRFPYSGATTPSRKIRAIHAEAAPPPVDGEWQQWLYVDNGFASLNDMRLAFAPVTAALLSRTPRSVMHLSCRNGALLNDIAIQGLNAALAGIDADSSRIARARKLLPTHAERLHERRLDDETLPSCLAPAETYMVMVGRLLELPAELAMRLLAIMRTQGQGVLLYAFDDWLRKSPLEELAAKLGVTLTTEKFTTDRAAAAWLT